MKAINADLIKARDKVTQAKAQYDREKRIYDQGAGVKSRLDMAEYEYKASGSAVDYQVARLDLAKRNLRKTTLYSPYSGSIASRSVQPHEEVQTGQTVFGINATGKMEVQLGVSENSIERIHINDPVTMTFPTLPGQTAKGRISYIGSAADQANSFPVKVELSDSHEKVKPGMTAEVIFAIANKTGKPGFSLPPQAILLTKEANRGYVFLYDSGTSTVKKTPVRVQGTEEKNAIVYKGLRPGDTIAVAGVSFLADGMTVKLMKQ
jgi:RND family efflux transporter MFP subunit